MAARGLAALEEKLHRSLLSALRPMAKTAKGQHSEGRYFTSFMMSG
jgi:hypothetical protein